MPSLQPALGRPLLHTDLDDTPEDGNRYEVIDGSLYVTPFPSFPHQRAATRLTAILHDHVREHDLGEVFISGLKVVLDEPTGVGPDVVFIAAARMEHMRRDGFYGAPDLLVEVLSSKPNLDRVIKFHKYASAGVPHYWIVDPDEHRLRAYRTEGNTYRLEAEHAGDSRFCPALFPDLAIELRDLWVP